ncbi:hypothetical protein SE17_10285 [Kouleothrix aurantiaca]|uniref:DinB-like domain-containing protein n=1 Tax=Kouleothrix aurantiaca TaxID=186479 RepID=A0A0P9F9J2_9CHLR|nr:hypothetical protein SE17_10285 [Kouleothrix aurantiaca]
MMGLDAEFDARNRAATERLRAVAARLSDADLARAVGEHWTVGVVYAHIAFWDRRVMYVLDKTERDGAVFIPDLDIFVNDLSLPLWLAIPPREAVRIALENAEELDERLATYPPALLEAVYETNPRWVERARHRGEHLDEAEAALRG